MKSATEGLPIEITQSTSDEGKGICHPVEQDLGVQHSPDLFHVQQDLVRGTSIALSSQRQQAEKEVEKAALQVSRIEAQQTAATASNPELEAVRGQERQARQDLETIIEQKEQVSQVIRDISQDYHPYHLATGLPRSAEQLQTALGQHFADIETVATATRLPERCLKKINKAKRMIVDMVATLAFFWLTVQAKVKALSLPPTVEQAVYSNLIPAIYLHLVSEKVHDPQQRSALQTRSDMLLAPLLHCDGPLSGLQTEAIRSIERIALECAQCFQRSSSCVEGRNGQLSLRHHSLHCLRDRKLTALTTVHNYFIQRSDGTTPAERFFGAKPNNLFEWLLDWVDLPGWPAQKRSQPNRKEFLSLPTP